jgi:hypothetical protein
MHPLTISFLLYLLWRTTVLVEYAGLYLAALVPGLLLLAFGSERPQANRRSDALPSLVSATSLFICGAYLLAGHILGFTQATGVAVARFKASLFPSIPWIIGFLVPDRLRNGIVLTRVGVISAALLAGFSMNSLVSRCKRRDPVTSFLAGTVSTFAILYLFYVQLNDTYLSVFVPFVLVAICYSLRERSAHSRHIWLISVCSMALGIIVGFWMRADYNKQEAVWKASEQIRFHRRRPDSDSGESVLGRVSFRIRPLAR